MSIELRAMMKHAPQGAYKAVITGVQVVESPDPTVEDKLVVLGKVKQFEDLGELVLLECDARRAERKLGTLIFRLGSSNSEKMDAAAKEHPIDVVVTVGEFTNDEGKVWPVVEIK